MDKSATIELLKIMLRQDIAYLCSRSDRLWNEPIVRTLRDLKDDSFSAVFFGGTLRSLLFSRLLKGTLGRPRDLDIVVSAVTLETLRERFRDIVIRETRFGGLQLLRSKWQFDIWPLNSTWAFVKDHYLHPSFDALPSTTFFNLEAIAVEVWPASGTSRITYSGDNQFFDGVLSRTLEINRSENPFPTLCIVRALVLASAFDLNIGPRLVSYLAEHSAKTTNVELDQVQLKHYGVIRHRHFIMRSWLNHIVRHFGEHGPVQLRLPLTRQLTLWPENSELWPVLNRFLSKAPPAPRSRVRPSTGNPGLRA